MIKSIATVSFLQSVSKQLLGDITISAPLACWSTIHSLTASPFLAPKRRNKNKPLIVLCTDSALSNPISCWWCSFGVFLYNFQPRDLHQWRSVEIPSWGTAAPHRNTECLHQYGCEPLGLRARVCEIMACLHQLHGLGPWDPSLAIDASEVSLDVLQCPSQEVYQVGRRCLTFPQAFFCILDLLLCRLWV